MFKKIATNTIAQIFSKFATALISIFLLSILTNYLSVELFGVYSKVYNYLGIFAFLADLGLYTIMIREISKINPHPETLSKGEGTKQIEKIVGNVLTLRVFLGIIIIFLALAVAYFLPSYNSNLELLAIAIVGVFTLISLMNSTFLAYMQSQLKMEFSLFSVVFGKLINLLIIVLIVFVFITDTQQIFLGNVSGENLGIISILGAGLVGIIINTGLNYWYVNKSCKIGFRFNWDYIQYIFKVSLPYGIALFLGVVYFKIDVIILSLLEGEKSDISIALYSLPMKIVEVLMVIGGFYLNSILPKLTQLFEKKEKELSQSDSLQGNSSNGELQKLLEVSFKILFSFGLMVFTFGVVFREKVIEIIANKDYLDPVNHIYNSGEAFFIVLGVLLFYFISLLYIYIFIGAKKQGILLKINIVITLFNIIGNILIIPYYSFIGAGVITLVSQILLFLITYYFSRRIVKFSFPKMFILKILLLSSSIFTSLYYLLNNYSLGLYLDVIIYGAIFSGIYSYIIYREIKKST